jgi:hypothetical protein
MQKYKTMQTEKAAETKTKKIDNVTGKLFFHDVSQQNAF